MQYECRVTTYRQAKPPVGNVFTVDAANETEAGEAAKRQAQAKYGNGGHAVRGVRPHASGWTVEQFPGRVPTNALLPARCVPSEPSRRWLVKACFAPGNPESRVLAVEATDEDAAAEIALRQLKAGALGRIPRILGIAPAPLPDEARAELLAQKGSSSTAQARRKRLKVSKAR